MGVVSPLVACALISRAVPVAAQTAAAPAVSSDTARDEGIPIGSEIVRTKCGSCHRRDQQGRMSRISYRRATPENWERTIKRMATLNKVALEPADARAILKYLADHQGLAPEEERPIAFEAERRTIEYSYTADKDTSDTCSSCHSMARVLAERRTKEEWELLIAMHRGYYPLVDNQPMNGGQGFRRTRPRQTDADTDGRPADNRHPMDKAIEHLTKALPLTTADWATWFAAMQPPKLAGRWAIVGTAPGKGSILSFTVEGVHPHDVGTILDHHGIAVRAGHHCAQPVMDRFGVPATVRASLGMYNTEAEVDELAAAVRHVREIFA